MQLLLCCTFKGTALQLILGLLNLLSNVLDELLEDVGLGLNLVALRGSKSTLGQDAVESGRLLLDPALVLAELVKDADVVLGILQLGSLLELASLLLYLGGDLGERSATSQLLDEGIEDSDGASGVVELTAGETVRTSLFVDVLENGGLGSGSVVVDALLVASGKELDGRVGLDTILGGHGLAVGGLGIDLGNDDVLLVGERGSDEFPDGGKLLAV